jgi:hypothetical protein
MSLVHRDLLCVAIGLRSSACGSLEVPCDSLDTSRGSIYLGIVNIELTSDQRACIQRAIGSGRLEVLS